MKKKLSKSLSLLLTFSMILTMLPAFSLGASAAESWTEVASATDLIDKVKTTGNYKLTQDIELSATLKIDSKTVKLDLNGHTIYSTANDAAINNYKGKLTILDSTADGDGRITVANSVVATGAKGIIQTNGSSSAKTTIKGGTIDGNAAGGASITGVYNGTNAATEISGGSIINCSSDFGGIYVFNGTVTMTGGVVDTCTSTSNSAVYVKAGGTFELNGGTIQNCSVTGNGGAVYLAAGTSAGGGGIFNMESGLIQNCGSTGGSGGGVYIADYAEFAMSGGMIKGCTVPSSKYGGGVYIGGSSGKPGSFTMSGGIISNCKGRNNQQSGFYKSGDGNKPVVTGGWFCNSSAIDTSGGYKKVAADFAHPSYAPNTVSYSYEAAADTAVAKVGNVSFEKLQDAFNGFAYDGLTASNKVATVTLLNNTTEKVTVPAETYYKLDLNGKTLTASGSAGNAVTVKGSLEIVSDNEDGAIDGAGSNRGLYVNGGNVTLTSGKIKNCSRSNNGGGVYIDLNGSFTMNGGKIGTCASGGAIYVSKGTAQITGGTIQNSLGKSDSNNSSISVIGGTFGENPSAYVSQTLVEEAGRWMQYTVSGDTAPYTVSWAAASAKAEVNGEEYLVFDDAVVGVVNCGEEPVTLKLLENLSIGRRHALRNEQGSNDSTNRSITLDLNGKTLDVGAGDGAFLINSGSTMTITGDGTVEQTAISSPSYFFTANSESEVIIENGTFTGSASAILAAYGGNLTICGGDFSGLTKLTKFTAGSGKVTITGGDFSGLTKLTEFTQISKKVTITGGKFALDPSAYVSQTPVNEAGTWMQYKVTEDAGIYEVIWTAADMTAEIVGGEQYPTLELAYEAAQAGDTLKLLDNIVLDKKLSFGKDITLDLGGKTLSIAKNDPVSATANFVIQANTNVNLTIGDSSEEGTGRVSNAGYGAVRSYKGSVTIKSGIFLGELEAYNKESSILVIGGTFSEDPGACVSKLVSKENNVWNKYVVSKDTSVEPNVYVVRWDAVPNEELIAAVYDTAEDTTPELYPTLQSAIDEAGKGAIVCLRGDVTEDVTIAEGKDITLDLAGYTLKSAVTDTTDNTITVAVGAKLVVCDSSEEQTGKIDGAEKRRGIRVNGTAELQSGTIVNCKRGTTYNGGAVMTGSNGSFTMSGGTIIAFGDWSNTYGQVESNSTLIWKSQGRGSAVFVSTGSFTMTGGTVVGDIARQTQAALDDENAGEQQQGSITITGGYVSAPHDVLNDMDQDNYDLFDQFLPGACNLSNTPANTVGGVNVFGFVRVANALSDNLYYTVDGSTLTIDGKTVAAEKVWVAIYQTNGQFVSVVVITDKTITLASDKVTKVFVLSAKDYLPLGETFVSGKLGQ